MHVGLSGLRDTSPNEQPNQTKTQKPKTQKKRRKKVTSSICFLVRESVFIDESCRWPIYFSFCLHCVSLGHWPRRRAHPARRRRVRVQAPERPPAPRCHTAGRQGVGLPPGILGFTVALLWLLTIFHALLSFAIPPPPTLPLTRCDVLVFATR